MRLTNKLKIVIIILLTYMAMLMTVNTAFGQGGPGWPPPPPGGGNPWGGPPPQQPCWPPPCVPVGSTESMFMFGVGALLFFGLKIRKKNSQSEN